MPTAKKTAHTATKKSASTRTQKRTPSHAQTPNHSSRNNYPNVLVHGMCGWGKDEIFGQYFRYWGGLKGDIQEYLKSKGYETFVASMGPISSNWDRACELYAFLRGGMVDYGAVHSARYGHSRYGRSYPGVFPQWSETNKVHLIGHSQGGPTSRTLIQLLEHGDADEVAFVPGSHEAPSSDLFKGGKRWVHSLTSVAGVHNGTPVADDMGALIADLLHAAASTAGLAENEPIFDFSLQQWGLEREKGEGFAEYIRRCLGSKIWKTNDCCAYDLSLVAAHFQNALVLTSPDVYYSSYAVDGTFEGPLGVRLPAPNMNPALKLGGVLIGKNERDLPGGADAWRPNDGAVPVPSAQYPFGHAHEAVVAGNTEKPKKGVWYVHPTLTGKDHISVITPWLNVTIEELNAFYEGIASHNRSLPA